MRALRRRLFVLALTFALSAGLPSRAAVDVDLTKMGPTMLFAAVYDIRSNPARYLGKAVKMTGRFAIIQGTDAQGQPDPDKIFYNCVIPQAQSSLEFDVADELFYPEDFPDLESMITVSGVYESYEDNGKTYYRVGKSQIEF